MAKRAQKVERDWKKKYKKHIEELTNSILNNAEKTGRLNLSDVEFESLVMKHRLEVVEAATRDAKKAKPKSNLAAKKLSFLEVVRRQYDIWRTKGKLPKTEKKIADGLKNEYIKRIQNAYKKHGEEFRSGKTYNQTQARIKIQNAANVSYARAQTIVNTETTRYYNEARVKFYEEEEGVTHYLFMCIRDLRTTKWCNTRYRVVYKKDSAILRKETPPIHWNCRSELLPLTPSNPRHKKMIDDKSSLRENRSPEKLPPGWNK
jgi:SPP1 gp7 family putative phage head morphogenesis protein